MVGCPRSGSRLDGACTGQRRTDLVAVYRCKIWSDLSVPVDSCVSPAISRYCGDRTLHPPYRREYFPWFYPPEPLVRHIPLGADDALIPVVRRIRLCRRDGDGGVDKLPFRLESARSNVILGLRIYCGIPTAILLSKVVYTLVERFMKAVAVITVAGLLWACLQPEVLHSAPSFLKGLFGPHSPMPHPWDTSDATKLLTAITFAGLGGFWILFYSYWMRDKGNAMADHMGRITGPIAGKPETITSDGNLPDESPESSKRWNSWRRYLAVDSLTGISGNLLTTLMTCLLAYALLFPKGLLPNEYELAVEEKKKGSHLD